MKESKNKSNSYVKLIASILALSIFVSMVTSSIVVKTLVPTTSTSTSTPTNSPTVQPSPVIQVLPSAISDTAKLQSKEIEANLLQNNGFENGLSGWTYTDNQEDGSQTGITVFETTGVNGKAYCSRRFLFGTQTELLNKEFAGFVQDISIDPTHPYFFSAWVKLYNATDAIAQGKTYYDSKPRSIWNLNLNLPRQHEDTTKGWFYIERYLDIGVPSGGLPTWTSIVIGFWHRPIQRDTTEGVVDSTFCIDDVVFGKIVK